MHVAGERSTATLADLKAQLLEMSGSKNGLDLSEVESQAVVEHLRKFEGLGRPDPECMELAGTKWRVVFTDTSGTVRAYIRLCMVH
jgi:hypothetical protein